MGHTGLFEWVLYTTRLRGEQPLQLLPSSLLQQLVEAVPCNNGVVPQVNLWLACVIRQCCDTL